MAEPLRNNEAVLALIRRYVTTHVVVAVDAPLVISNMTGQRTCETAVGRRYGSRDASCHTSNLTLYPNAASVRLAIELQQDGFSQAPLITGTERAP